MDEMSSPRRYFWEGVGVAWGILFTFFLLAYAAFDTWSDWGPNGPTDEWTNIPMLLLAFCGLSQLVYIIPCYIFFIKKKMPATAKGLLLGAASILSVNGIIYFWWLRG